MSRRWLVIARKKFRDFASLKLLVAFYVPYLAIAWLFGRGVGTGAPDNMGSLPLPAQEQFLTETLAQLGVAWAVGIPLMVLVGVLLANGLAGEQQRGTLRILLSKPIARRDVLLGTYVAAIAFATLVAITGLLFLGSVLYWSAGASPAALGASIFALLPGLIVYAFVVIVFVASIATGFAVLSGSRLRTALGSLVVPALFFGFIFLRTIGGDQGAYRDFFLYVFDVNYHLGNVFVFLQGLVGVTFAPPTQAGLGLATGVYDDSAWGADPLVGGMDASVPLTGLLPQIVSVVVVIAVIVGLLALATRRFERMDIS